MTINKRTITAILAATLALSLLLAACGTGGDTPAVDNTTPGVSGPETPNNTQGATSPGEAPDESNTPDTSSTPEVNKAAEYEAGGHNAETKIALDKTIVDYGGMWGVDIDDAIEKVFEKYGEYLNENISKDAIRIGMVTSMGSPYFKPRGENPSGISPDAMKKVNDFLADNGEDELDSKIPEQNIAALWLAASLYYDPDVDNGYPAYDIAMPFGLARADSSEGSAEHEADTVWSAYAALFDLY